MRIKWIENIEDNFRGNFTPMCFKVNNSKYIFAYTSCMSYKTFKFLTRKLAQQFGAGVVEVFKDCSQVNMYIVNLPGCKFKFRIELNVREGEKRKFEFYEAKEIFDS